MLQTLKKGSIFADNFYLFLRVTYVSLSKSILDIFFFFCLVFPLEYMFLHVHLTSVRHQT